MPDSHGVKKIVLSFRSCWECNPAHKFLKKAKGLFYCFVCGRLFENGKLGETMTKQNSRNKNVSNTFFVLLLFCVNIVLAKNVSILCLGDSITEYQYSYCEQIRNITGFTVINKGISGNSLSQMKARLDTDVWPYYQNDTVNFLIIEGGVNDLYNWCDQRGPETPSTLLRDVQEISDMATARGWRPVVLNLPPNNYQMYMCSKNFNSTAAPINGWLGTNLTVVDIYTTLVDKDTGLANMKLYFDDIHPNREGHRRITMKILPYIAPERIFKWCKGITYYEGNIHETEAELCN